MFAQVIDIGPSPFASKNLLNLSDLHEPVQMSLKHVHRYSFK